MKTHVLRVEHSPTFKMLATLTGHLAGASLPQGSGSVIPGPRGLRPAPGTVKLSCARGQVGSLTEPSTAGPGSRSDVLGPRRGLTWLDRWGSRVALDTQWGPPGTGARFSLAHVLENSPAGPSFVGMGHVRICVCGQSGMEI